MFRFPLEHWGFKALNGRLHLGRYDLTALADREGTPFYLFDEQRLKTNIHKAHDALRDYGVKSRMYYSMKTNSHSGVLRIVRDEGLSVEVISSVEMERGIQAGFSLQDMILNGPGKTDSELETAASAGALIHVESLSEAESLVHIADDIKKAVFAGVRINPDIYEERALKTLRMGAGIFGMAPESEEFKTVVQLFKKNKYVRFKSLSAHIGTGIISVEPYQRLISKLLKIRNKLQKQNVDISLIDIGGGFSVASEVRYSQSRFDELVSEAGDVPSPDEIETFDDICKAIAEVLPQEQPPIIVMEPGRSLVSDSFHLLTRVVRIKEHKGEKIAVVDAGRVQNALFVGRGYHEFIHAGDPLGAKKENYTIAGPLCAELDIYARSKNMPELKEGDVILIADVGAYNLSAQSQWSHKPAQVKPISDYSEP